ncbi:MAG: DUF3575 domain-containing protein [Duncaniella sp.]|uniref:DUF3575 domain-containing protein n=1 Tax=Duncaniella sp. TaxID=2518496 RepID=UPI0023CD910A|nr:DUF3575 domain-containing protein [Duncaniella sp.]MDE5988037.1 DUF3575 domain-containing protein [Duncaniella sp.]
MKKLFFLILLAGFLQTAHAKSVLTDSVDIRFRVAKTNLDPDFANNRHALKRIADSLQNGYSDSIYRLTRAMVIGAASPEGSVTLNQKLSEKRAQSIFGYLQRYGKLPENMTTFKFLGRDWRGLRELVRKDYGVPSRERVLELLDEIIYEVDEDSPRAETGFNRLKALAGGAPYRYMLKYLFPDLRSSKLIVWYERIPNPTVIYQKGETVHHRDTLKIEKIVRDTVIVRDTIPRICPKTPWYAAIKTNMLYDALLVPNIGVEVAFADRWSVAANWMYAWWDCDKHHRYWRIYGGDIEGRWWFGNLAMEKPLQGHHIGAYGQLLTYDIENGHRGWQGAKYNYAAGFSYGFALPIARHLNLDFDLGLGYMWGKYKTYKPIDGHYVWQSTKKRKYFGPTKVEVSLVWLIGTDNYNKKKGGSK